MEASHTVPNPNGVTSPTPLRSWKCYSSTKDITCHTFWNCILDGVLERLVYDGSLTDAERQSKDVQDILSDAWKDILIEHAETINNDAIDTQQSIVDYEIKKSKIMWAGAAILYLKKDYHKELTDRLRKMFKTAGVKLDITQPFQFQRDLDRCIAVAKTWQFELTKVQDNLNEMYGDKTVKPQLSYKSFNKTLIPMSKFVGGERLTAKNLSVYDYDTIYSEMIAEMDLRNQQK